ncbi:unnamed protein product [Thelazia callipaeda]|uniref:RING-type domain-containing protein n=1 Tax=Thelazia callipaeda TaxID=103827 RepID=A0A0N5D739_THECL|nr:unnamed protein product [Thelazia callipaeda]
MISSLIQAEMQQMAEIRLLHSDKLLLLSKAYDDYHAKISNGAFLIGCVDYRGWWLNWLSDGSILFWREYKLKMSFMTNDLDVKYGAVNQKEVVAKKKKRRKSKRRILEIDFTPPPDNWSRSDSNVSCNVKERNFTSSSDSSDDYLSDVFSRLVPVMRDVLINTVFSKHEVESHFFYIKRIFLKQKFTKMIIVMLSQNDKCQLNFFEIKFVHCVGNRAFLIEEAVDYLKASDISVECKQMLSSLNDSQLHNLFEQLNLFYISYEGSKIMVRMINKPSSLFHSNRAVSRNIFFSNINNQSAKTPFNCILDSPHAKPLSSITNDFIKLPQQHLNGTETMKPEQDALFTSHRKVNGVMIGHKDSTVEGLFIQHDRFYDQNTELMDGKFIFQKPKIEIMKRCTEQRLKAEKRCDEKLFSMSLMLKKAYKEILDLRLGKAKALANKRIGQAEFALIHANIVYNRVDDKMVRADIRYIIKEWEQIRKDYKDWHANLDEIVDGQKAQVDSNYNFDELALLSPPDHIPCAPQLPPYALKYFQRLEFECSFNDSSSEVLRFFGAPVAFEKEMTGGRFGAIGQPAPPLQRKVFTRAQIDEFDEIVERTMKHFQSHNPHGGISDLKAEQIKKVVSELDQRPLVHGLSSNFSSVLSHVKSSSISVMYCSIKVVRRITEMSDVGNENTDSKRNASCWASLPETSASHRPVNSENQKCLICFLTFVDNEKLIECPSCFSSYHHRILQTNGIHWKVNIDIRSFKFKYLEGCGNPETRASLKQLCGTKWLKQNCICPFCRQLWSNPDDFPSLSRNNLQQNAS